MQVALALGSTPPCSGQTCFPAPCVIWPRTPPLGLRQFYPCHSLPSRSTRLQDPPVGQALGEASLGMTGDWTARPPGWRAHCPDHVFSLAAASSAT